MTTAPWTPGSDVWINDDPLLGPNGEEMSQVEFEARYPDAIDIGGPVEGSRDESH